MKITIVKINPEGDGVTAMYINGEQFTSGDYYHNKIDTWIQGFLEGLDYATAEYTLEKLYVTDETSSEVMKMDLMLDPPQRVVDYPEGVLTENY